MSTITVSPAFAPTRSSRTARTSSRSAVRLTRRGRVVVLMASLALVLMAGFFLGSVAVGTNEAGQTPATEIVMVEPGQSLWSIASDLTDSGDVRTTMREIERLNALDTVALSAGQKLRVPVSDD
ncbi:LysM peptidoglycan-binding domain-containing protein [Nocardioides sp. Soil777]|uniref:LysM peptidoglycan-binding domain-containing protein n=1 Tax=Nocardioides sp. Soil777 TaxID=1736409 RepID=UPI0009E87CB1|nr:LysM peptidoglycan-binding domain-containing protein [Nocardioides sp. Soil777]